MDNSEDESIHVNNFPGPIVDICQSYESANQTMLEFTHNTRDYFIKNPDEVFRLINIYGAVVHSTLTSKISDKKEAERIFSNTVESFSDLVASMFKIRLHGYNCGCKLHNGKINKVEPDFKSQFINKEKD